MKAAQSVVELQAKLGHPLLRTIDAVDKGIRNCRMTVLEFQASFSQEKGRCKKTQSRRRLLNFN